MSDNEHLLECDDSFSPFSQWNTTPILPFVIWPSIAIYLLHLYGHRAQPPALYEGYEYKWNHIDLYQQFQVNSKGTTAAMKITWALKHYKWPLQCIDGLNGNNHELKSYFISTCLSIKYCASLCKRESHSFLDDVIHKMIQNLTLKTIYIHFSSW